MKRLFAVLCIGLIFMSGCATIIHGTSQDVGISSVPSQAEVQIDNQTYGKTPFVAKISRGDNHIIRLKLDGFQIYEAILTKTVSGWVWGNIVFGGLIGLAVDAIGGGIYYLNPEQVTAQMAANPSNIKASGDSINIFVVLKPLPEWKKVSSLEPTKFPYTTTLN